MQIVSLILIYHITCDHCSLKKNPVPMKMFIISDRNNCMNKASSVTDSSLQNFNQIFFVKVDIYTSFLSLLMIIRKGRLMLMILCNIAFTNEKEFC